MNEHWQQMPVVRGFDTLQPLYECIDGRGYVAGSYAAFMAYGGDTPILPNDIDVFATTEQHAYKLADDIDMKLNYFMESSNDTAYTLTSFTGLPGIQVVRPNPNWKVWPDDILSDFDLDICRAVLISPNTVIADEHASWSRGKLLRINNPLRSLKRVMKYAARGVEFDDHELLKLFQSWDQVSTERKEAMIAIAAKELNAVDAPADYYSGDDWFEGE